MVIDQARDPSLDVCAAEVDEEGTLQIDMPKLVGPTPLIAAAQVVVDWLKHDDNRKKIMAAAAATIASAVAVRAI